MYHIWSTAIGGTDAAEQGAGSTPPQAARWEAPANPLRPPGSQPGIAGPSHVIGGGMLAVTLELLDRVVPFF